MERVEEELTKVTTADPGKKDAALKFFDWTQNAAEIWRGSNNRVRRDILDAVCLNRTLSDVSLDTTKESPLTFWPKGSI